ncbi:MAG: hypothetical protein LQ340_001179 [Diploschistes diacapsis]|nr:MAG: hypothetical protein LQ340_001179 [Diploschistes diacapsis]
MAPAWMKSSPSSPRYSKLDPEGTFLPADEERAGYLTSETGKASRWSRPAFLRTVPWLFTAGFAALYLSTFATRTAESQWGTFSGGLKTEFQPAMPHIELELRRFTSGVLFTPAGEPYRTKYPGKPEYVGPPSPEVDANWEKLIGSRYFSVTDEEAEQIADKENKKTWDKHADWGFLSGFDVLHSLHCVVRAITSLLFILKLQNADPEEQNMVRKGLDGDYYYPEKDLYEHHSRNHLGTSAIPFPHLLNVPRLLFCHAEQWHVCRKYEPIREYTTSRFNGSEAVVPLSFQRLTAGHGQGRLAEGGHCPGCLPDMPGAAK